MDTPSASRRTAARRSAVVLRTAALTAIAALGVGGLAACGGDDPAPAPSSTTAAASTDLTSFYEGRFVDPPTDGPAAVRGKSVWWISCGEIYEACAQKTRAFRRYGDLLGWKVTVVDGKTDYALASATIRQAISARADAIVLDAYDCPGIKGALQQAKTAKIPTVAEASADCDAPGLGGEPLFTKNVAVGGEFESYLDFISAWGADKARYVAAAMGGKGKILHFGEESQYLQRYNDEGFMTGAKECSGCEVVRTGFTFAEVPNGKLAQKIRGVIQQNPDAEWINAPFDAVIQLAFAQVLQQTGKAGKLKMIGGEGFDANLDYMRQNIQTAAQPYSWEWYTAATADAVNRIFAEGPDAEIPGGGGGWQVIDTDHGLPASGSYKPPVDFEAAFRKIWSGEAR